MYLIDIDDQEIEHNIRALLTSFYPGCDIAYNSEGADVELSISVKGTLVSIGDEQYTIDSLDRLFGVTKLIYKILSKNTGISLPWGMLTGVRPSKILYSHIASGSGRDECIDYLVKERFVSPKKAKLAYEVASKEYKLLGGMNYSDHYSLYVGIPFCPTRCLYCSFTAYPISRYEKRVDEYLDALCRELAAVRDMMSGRVLDTIYIGGGTPTTLKPEQLDRLLGFIEEKFDLSNLKEFSLEAGRPDSIDEDKLRVIGSHRVDRISINPQTMQDKTLEVIGRKHKVEDIYKAYDLAKIIGFTNINMDLIAGLPGESSDEFRDSLMRCIELKPSNITVHCLSVKRAARLNLMKDVYKDMTFDGIEVAVPLSFDLLSDAGYKPYYMYRQRNQAGNQENVGYSMEGSECLYNILIMEELQTIIACGAGAASKFVYPQGDRNRIERAENVKDVEGYIKRIDEMIERKRILWNN